MIGKKIKQFRENAGMSQEALAEQMGVSRQAVSKWENDLSVPDMQNLLKLSQLFGVSMEIWTEEAEGEPPLKKDKNGERRIILLCLIIAGCCAVPILIVLWFLLVNTAGTQYHETGISTVEEIQTEEDYFVYDDAATEEAQKAEAEDALYFATEQTDYLNSPESVALQETVWNFARAYFSCDKQEAEKYTVIKKENLDVWETDVWDDLAVLNLKWNPDDLAEREVIPLQYEFRMNGEDSNTYLGLNALLIQGEWKITDVYLEK